MSTRIVCSFLTTRSTEVRDHYIVLYISLSVVITSDRFEYTYVLFCQ